MSRRSVCPKKSVCTSSLNTSYGSSSCAHGTMRSNVSHHRKASVTFAETQTTKSISGSLDTCMSRLYADDTPEDDTEDDNDVQIVEIDADATADDGDDDVLEEEASSENDDDDEEKVKKRKSSSQKEVVIDLDVNDDDDDDDEEEYKSDLEFQSGVFPQLEEFAINPPIQFGTTCKRIECANASPKSGDSEYVLPTGSPDTTEQKLFCHCVKGTKGTGSCHCNDSAKMCQTDESLTPCKKVQCMNACPKCGDSEYILPTEQQLFCRCGQNIDDRLSCSQVNASALKLICRCNEKSVNGMSQVGTVPCPNIPVPKPCTCTSCSQEQEPGGLCRYYGNPDAQHQIRMSVDPGCNVTANIESPRETMRISVRSPTCSERKVMYKNNLQIIKIVQLKKEEPPIPECDPSCDPTICDCHKPCETYRTVCTCPPNRCICEVCVGNISVTDSCVTEETIPCICEGSSDSICICPRPESRDTVCLCNPKQSSCDFSDECVSSVCESTICSSDDSECVSSDYYECAESSDGESPDDIKCPFNCGAYDCPFREDARMANRRKKYCICTRCKCPVCPWSECPKPMKCPRNICVCGPPPCPPPCSQPCPPPQSICPPQEQGPCRLDGEPFCPVFAGRENPLVQIEKLTKTVKELKEVMNRRAKKCKKQDCEEAYHSAGEDDSEDKRNVSFKEYNSNPLDDPSKMASFLKLQCKKKDMLINAMSKTLKLHINEGEINDLMEMVANINVLDNDCPNFNRSALHKTLLEPPRRCPPVPPCRCCGKRSPCDCCIPCCPPRYETFCVDRQCPGPVEIESCHPTAENAMFVRWRIHSFVGIAGFQVSVDGCEKCRIHTPLRDQIIIPNVNPRFKHIITVYAVPQLDCDAGFWAPAKYFYVPDNDYECCTVRRC